MQFQNRHGVGSTVLLGNIDSLSCISNSLLGLERVLQHSHQIQTNKIILTRNLGNIPYLLSAKATKQSY